MSHFITRRKQLYLGVTAAMLIVFGSLLYSLGFPLRNNEEGQALVHHALSGQMESQREPMQPNESSPADQQAEELDDSGGYMWERMELSPELRQAYEEMIRRGQNSASTSTQSEEGYRFRGSVVSMEDFMKLRELTRREMGMQAPVMPFRDRHAILQGQIEAQGRDPDELYPPYGALIDSILAAAESPSLAVPIEQEAPGTLALMGLFQRSDREGVEAFVEERLKANERDLPALLVRLDVAISDAAVESVFDTLEQLVDAVAERQPKIVDSDALYYYLLLIGSKYAYLTEDALEDFMESSVKGYDLQLVSKPILHALERDGEW